MARQLLPRAALRDGLDLYLNADERRQIELKARTAGLSLSSFIRRAALGQKVEAPPGEGSVRRWHELARTTANLNQIAHAINAGRATGIDPIVISELAELVRLLRLELLGSRGDGS
jgi:hypothetical protein